MAVWIAIIQACGAALIGGAITLITSHISAKREKAETENAVILKLSEVERKLDAHIEEDKEAKADDARARIIDFGSSVVRQELHTAEQWHNILLDIDRYENFCDTHPAYENNRAVSTIAMLKDRYQEKLAKNDFLT